VDVTPGDHGSDEVLQSYAASRRFTLGRPRDLTLVPGRRHVVFLRSVAADDPVTALWTLDLAAGAERMLADPRDLLGDAPEVIPAAELSRRERMRESARGIVAYSADAAGRAAAFALSGRLFVCDLETGGTREVPIAGDCVDPQLDPAGTAIGYLDGGALRVVTLDGRAVIEASGGAPTAASCLSRGSTTGR
jgi:dipeptidyl-peptidase 4